MAVYIDDKYNTTETNIKDLKEISDNLTRNLNNEQLRGYIDVLTNIIKISDYINAHLLEENLIETVNYMIISMMHVEYSVIFVVENGELVIKGSNIRDIDMDMSSEEIMYINNRKEFVINSDKSIKTFKCGKQIHSIIGVPIILNGEFMGYIILSDERYGFLGKEIKVFLDSIAIQIANSIKNSRVYKKLDNLTKKDPLLDIFNRKYFFELLESKFVDNNKFAIVMMDIDDFKNINDNYGHQIGDEVLQSTVNIIKLWLEKGDIISRYGGEEFVLYLSDFDSNEDVFNKIDIIRKSIERNIIKINDKQINVTVSFGIAFYPLDGADVTSLIKTADDLLYKSKEDGKNGISIAKGSYNK